MLIERELSEHDLPLLAQIDRSERVEANYRLENGELILYPVHVDMRGWPEGEAEENALGAGEVFAARRLVVWRFRRAGAGRRWLWITGLSTIRG
jgi:hypothetical protein